MSHTSVPDHVNTPVELIKWMNNTFGMSPWPKRMLIKPALYGHCCQYIFDSSELDETKYFFKIALGPINGLMFKNVELILSSEE